MKKFIIFLSVASSSCVFSQIAIGKNSISNPSVSLEFYDGNDNKKGMILPWVISETAVNNPVNGTLMYDLSAKKVKLRSANTWLDLSLDENGVVDSSLQDNLIENSEARVVIGDNPDQVTTSGILVLPDNYKAMVLPKVASPHANIVRPEPGTIVFDTVTKQLAIYNGTVWSFWQPIISHLLQIHT